jgi:hypothetical protein
MKYLIHFSNSKNKKKFLEYIKLYFIFILNKKTLEILYKKIYKIIIFR